MTAVKLARPTGSPAMSLRHPTTHLTSKMSSTVAVSEVPRPARPMAWYSSSIDSGNWLKMTRRTPSLSTPICMMDVPTRAWNWPSMSCFRTAVFSARVSFECITPYASSPSFEPTRSFLVSASAALTVPLKTMQVSRPVTVSKANVSHVPSGRISGSSVSLSIWQTVSAPLPTWSSPVRTSML
jgi:hypothetical protein